VKLNNGHGVLQARVPHDEAWHDEACVLRIKFVYLLALLQASARNFCCNISCAHAQRR
jgi:hypothetical protein